VETTKIASLGFPNRIAYDQFALRYALVIRGLGTPKPGQPPATYAAISKKIIEGLKVPAEDFRIGKTKLFLRSGFVADMEATRDKALNVRVL
jgi:myosin heavy subunit